MLVETRNGFVHKHALAEDFVAMLCEKCGQRKMFRMSLASDQLKCEWCGHTAKAKNNRDLKSHMNRNCG
jgi:uncharacterized protein (DUF983 family)